MLKCRLLFVHHLETRAGRAIRHYSCVSNAFFVPFSATPFETVSALVQSTESLQHQRFAKALAYARELQHKNQGLGTLLFRDEAGDTYVSKTNLNQPKAAQVTVPFSRWSSMRLTPKAALELTERLDSLLNEYMETSAKTGTSYLLHIGVVEAI